MGDVSPMTQPTREHDMTANPSNPHDKRVALLIEAIEHLKRGEYDLTALTLNSADDPDRLRLALQDLARTLDRDHRETQRIDQITARINAGLLLDEILDNVYDDFRELIPYNRIGLSLIEDDGKTVRARWSRSDQPCLYLKPGYSARLAGSSLQTIIETGQPRILNDLEAYLRHKPKSTSTRHIVREGLRSSLTCPLIANDVPIGFLFFSSVEPGTYRDVHVDTFQRIARQLAVMVEKGRLASELAAQKEAAERQNRELHRLNELKTTFLGIAAHDLRSPLAMIEMAANLLLDPNMQPTDEEQSAVLEDILRESRYMLELIDELLDVSEIESGNLQLNRQTIVLQDFLTEAVRRHNQLAAPKGTQVLLVTELAPTHTVIADPRRLRQAIDNLISNAVKYSPFGAKVWIRAENIPGGWRISVQDEGPGIALQDQQRLFQDFVRLSSTPTGGEKSVGLGLAITRRMIEAHGGQVGVEPGPDRGATFWFTLPA
jgi:signal transduction histidine kinase